ncbi:MAG: hypothetical protein P8K78_07660 [Pirellulales bacterium]|nr:hypothetical protein [Pirellulales bacterium]
MRHFSVRFFRNLSFSLIFSGLLATVPAMAVMPSAEVLPNTTRGFLSIPDFYRLQDDFDKTQIGQLLLDPVMEPFSKDLKRQLKEKWSDAHESLGITWTDIENVPGGEVAVARIQPSKDAAAMAMVVDITGKRTEADELLQKVAARMADRNATVETVKRQNIEMTVYTATTKEEKGNQAVFFIDPNHQQLVASDDLAVAEGILSRFVGGSTDSLASVKAFQATMQQVDDQQGVQISHLRWFVEPFGFIEATRAADPNYEPKKGVDLVHVLQTQGFDAIKGMGGLISFATGDQDILHRTMVFAPAVNRAPGEANTDKYDLAMRMLNFPNSDVASHQPPKWIPRNLAAYINLNMDLLNAFEYSKTLVNAVADDEIFDDVIDSLKNDPAGPQVDVRKDVVANLGQNVMVLSDYRLPIEADSERILVAVELTDVEPVRRAVDQTMRNDPNAQQRMVGDTVVWEIVEEEIEEPELDIELGFDDFEVEEEEEAVQSLPTSAVTVAHGRLILSSHFDFIKRVLTESDYRESLAGSMDYQTVNAELLALGASSSSIQTFSRTDEEFRGTYELLKQGKMPESKTLVGRILNAMLDEDTDDEELREQQLDATKLPEYQMVRRYLGPAGMYVVSHDDGWSITGCFLSKETLQVVLKGDGGSAGNK